MKKLVLTMVVMLAAVSFSTANATDKKDVKVNKVEQLARQKKVDKNKKDFKKFDKKHGKKFDKNAKKLDKNAKKFDKNQKYIKKDHKIIENNLKK